MNPLRHLPTALSVLIVGILLTSCSGSDLSPKTSAIQPGSSQSTSSSEKPPEIKRKLEKVWAGTPGKNQGLPPLNDDKPRELRHGDRIKTNHLGEGWLYIGDCQTIYVFQDSQLTKSPNSKFDRKSGNTSSQDEGTSVWNNKCASQVVVETDSARIQLIGTWISVTYLPKQRTTVVMVFEGRTKVQSVQDLSARTLSESVDVSQGYFLFSSPGDRPTVIARLAARQPHSFSQLPRLIAALELWQWIPRIRERARMDHVPFPEFLVADCKVSGPDAPWNLYASPIDGNVVDKVQDGSLFTAMARSAEGGWIFGANAKDVGWISANAVLCEANLSQLPKILDLSPPSEPAPEEPSEPEFPRRRRFPPQPPERPQPPPPPPPPPPPKCPPDCGDGDNTDRNPKTNPDSTRSTLIR